MSNSDGLRKLADFLDTIPEPANLQWPSAWVYLHTYSEDEARRAVDALAPHGELTIDTFGITGQVSVTVQLSADVAIRVTGRPEHFGIERAVVDSVPVYRYRFKGQVSA